MPEKRKELIEIDREILQRKEEILREKYVINFEARNNKINENNNIENIITKEEQITEYKESIFKRIVYKILKFLHFKK